VRQGEMRRCGDGECLVQHDDLSPNWRETCPVRDRA